MKERTGAGKDTEKQRRKSIKKWRRKVVQEKEEYREAERKQDKKKRRRRKRKGNGEMGKGQVSADDSHGKGRKENYGRKRTHFTFQRGSERRNGAVKK